MAMGKQGADGRLPPIVVQLSIVANQKDVKSVWRPADHRNIIGRKPAPTNSLEFKRGFVTPLIKAVELPILADEKDVQAVL